MRGVTTCASASRELAEPVAATAATARTWLLVEQPGPWGASALTASRLDAAVGRALRHRADAAGVRLGLIRRPGHHASDDRAAPQRRVFAAHTVPGASWLRRHQVSDPAELLELDFGALGRGVHGGLGTPYDGEPLALVCTNGKRDRCCALLGRPLAGELAAAGAGEVWETTHLGGHRFAPTMLVLPYGYAYGRVDARSAKEIIAAAREGRMVPADCRGRSAWRRPGQAAELAVRELIGEDRAEALRVAGQAADPTGPAGGWQVKVVHEDGRAWTVEVEEAACEPPRPESCGAAIGSPVRMAVRGVRPHAAPHGA